MLVKHRHVVVSAICSRGEEDAADGNVRSVWHATVWQERIQSRGVPIRRRQRQAREHSSIMAQSALELLIVDAMCVTGTSLIPFLVFGATCGGEVAILSSQEATLRPPSLSAASQWELHVHVRFYSRGIRRKTW